MTKRSIKRFYAILLGEWNGKMDGLGYLTTKQMF